MTNEETQRGQALLIDLKALSATEALSRLEKFFEHSLEAIRGTEEWVLLQELRFQEGQLALREGHSLRCIRALEACEWREANELETRAVIAALPESDYGATPRLVKFRSGGYQVWGSPSDGRVAVGRLNSLFETLLFARFPSLADEEMLLLRDFRIASKDGEIMAKAAFHFHGAGQSELALGLLNIALAEGLSHPALRPSRDALVGKGFKADPAAQAWIDTYREQAGFGRGTPRIGLKEAWTSVEAIADAADKKRLARIKTDISKGRITAGSPAGEWILQAGQSDLKKHLNLPVLEFLVLHQPDRALALAPFYPDPWGQAMVHRALGRPSDALEMIGQLSLCDQFPILARLTHEAHGQPDRELFAEPARSAAQRLALDAASPEVWATGAVEWLAENDPGYIPWIEAHGGRLPPSAQAAATESAPRLGLRWIEQALHRDEGSKAAKLWTSLALGRHRGSLEAELRHLYPTVLASCQADIATVSGAISAAGSWNKSLDGDSRIAAAFGRVLHDRELRRTAVDYYFRFPELGVGQLAEAPDEIGGPLLQNLLARYPELLERLSGVNRPRGESILSRLRPCLPEAQKVPAILSETPGKGRPTKLPGFFHAASLPRPLLAGRLACLSLAHVQSLAETLAHFPDHEGLASVRQVCDAESLEEFAWELFSCWLASGADPKQKWAYLSLGHFGRDATVRRLTPLLQAWPQEGGFARAEQGLDLLCEIGSDVALMHLHSLTIRLKSKALKARAQQRLEQIAKRRGLTAEQLADRLVPTFELDADGSRTLDFGSRQFRVAFDQNLLPYVLEGGRPVANLPRLGKTDDKEKAASSLALWKALKKDVATVAKLQLQRLEYAMCARRQWSAVEFSQLFLAHPLLIHAVRRIVWAAYAEGTVTPFRVAEDSTLADVHDAKLELQEQMVGIAHPLDGLAAWNPIFDDYGLLQPFPQLGRPLYRPTEDEMNWRALSRFQGHVVQAGPLLGLLARGWSVEGPGLVRELPNGNRAILETEGQFTRRGDNDTTLGEMRLIESDGHTLRIADWDPVWFSELVYDITRCKARSG